MQLAAAKTHLEMHCGKKKLGGVIKRGAVKIIKMVTKIVPIMGERARYGGGSAGGAKCGAKVAGSESRADVAPKDRPVGVVAASESEGAREVRGVLRLKREDRGKARAAVLGQCGAERRQPTSDLCRPAGDGIERCFRAGGRGKDARLKGR